MNVFNWLVVFALKEQIHSHKQFTNLNRTYIYIHKVMHGIAMVASVTPVVCPVISLLVAIEAE